MHHEYSDQGYRTFSLRNDTIIEKNIRYKFKAIVSPDVMYEKQTELKAL
jgi:hypothetical protein